GDETTNPAGAGQTAIEARFELPQAGAPAFLDVPFPCDLYLDGDTLAKLDLGLVIPKNGNYLTAALAQTRGFGRIAGALFRIADPPEPLGPGGAPAAIDPASLPQTEADSIVDAASVMLVDLQATDPSSALIPARVQHHDDTSLGSDARPVLAVYPARGIVLSSNHQYAAVLTTSVRASDGTSVAPSATFR